MVWSTTKERPKRYLISAGRDKLRERFMENMWRIVTLEGSSMADEIWDALFMHVERHKDMLELDVQEDDGGDGRIHMQRDDDFEDTVINESHAAREEVVGEILDAERRVEQRMVRSDSFRNTGVQ